MEQSLSAEFWSATPGYPLYDDCRAFIDRYVEQTATASSAGHRRSLIPSAAGV
ncbi:MAG: hypothetical protein V4773_07765 [Verrucomicrobiota bacterium]